MKASRALLLFFSALLAAGCNNSSPPDPQPTIAPQQQVIFHNGTVLTMDEDGSQAEAMAIRGEKITSVGSENEVLALAAPGATVIDLQGATLMPGFVDAHTHLFNDAERYFDKSLAEVQQLALENGITTIGDLYVDGRFLKEIEAFAPALRIRTSLYLVMTDNCGEPQGDWYQEHPPTRNPGEMLRIGGVKIFTDGGTCGGPALSYELVEGEGLGDLFFA
jgi:predicted amidohydrolase YtcJ